MFPYFSPFFSTREQRKLLTIRNWTLLGLHVQNSSIYTYIMTWVYCQLSFIWKTTHVMWPLETCHVTRVNFLAKKKRLKKKKNGNRIYNKNINIGTEHYCWSDIMSTRTPKHIPRNTKIILLLNANTVFISKG